MIHGFLIEEFTEYKVFLYDPLAHDTTIDEAIVIPFSKGQVFFLFYNDSIAAPPNNTKDTLGTKERLFIHVPTSKFDRFIDILRNEKPLYLAMHTDKIWAYITTEMEPVGEGEEHGS